MPEADPPLAGKTHIQNVKIRSLVLSFLDFIFNFLF